MLGASANRRIREILRVALTFGRCSLLERRILLFPTDPLVFAISRSLLNLQNPSTGSSSSRAISFSLSFTLPFYFYISRTRVIFSVARPYVLLKLVGRVFRHF